MGQIFLNPDLNEVELTNVYLILENIVLGTALSPLDGKTIFCSLSNSASSPLTFRYVLALVM